MRSLPHRLSPLLILVALTLLARPAAAAWPHDPYLNLPVSTAANHQHDAVLATDGAGGVILAWADMRLGVSDIRAAHVLASGVLDPRWPADGLVVCDALGGQQLPSIVPDGQGGAIVAWQDYRGSSLDLYAHHLLPTGTLDPAWPATGLPVCTAANAQDYQGMIPDGAGGAIIAWQDFRNGADYDIYVQRVLAGGTVDPAWPADGRALCTAGAYQQAPCITGDGAGGAIVAWHDYRNMAHHDVYAQRVLASGALAANWPANGRLLCGQAGEQTFTTIVGDLAGGALVTWWDERAGNRDVYAQHVLTTGDLDALWPTNGLAVCSAANDQVDVVSESDGIGGAYLAWADARSGTTDIYAHHLLPTGAVDPVWPVNGRALAVVTGNQYGPQLAVDGAGGVIVAWWDHRSGSQYDLYAQRVLASGALDSGWPATGLAVSLAGLSQTFPRVVADGAGGVLMAWDDSRAGTLDVYAQRIGPFGVLGTPEPEIHSARDVPNDEGGWVNLEWDASWLDSQSPPVVDHYWVFRSLSQPLAARALAAGAARITPDGPAPMADAPAVLETVTAGGTSYWEYVGQQQALHFLPGYSLLVPTASDSTAAGVPPTTWMVVARDVAGEKYWLSSPVAGHSVDDLAPAAPVAFTGSYIAGSAALTWRANTEPDLAAYRLYRGTTPGFAPGPGNLVAEMTATAYLDDAGGPAWYKLSAVDAHGNEGGYAALLPDGTVDVPGEAPRELALERPSPNPASGAALVRFALPREAPVSLEVRDLAGRRVRTLARGTLPAGAQALAWDLRDDSGDRVGPGVYLLTLTTDGRSLTRRVVTLR